MSVEERRRASAGLMLFVLLCLLGSWFVAATLRVFGLNVAPGPLGTRLFTTLLLYAITMGWQPLLATWVVRRWVDPPEPLDMGLRPSRRVFDIIGALAGAGIVLAAALVAWALVSAGAMRPFASASPESVGAQSFALLLFASLGTFVLGAAQAMTEEVGWRGYFLVRAMQRFGRWRGLVLQGAVWGVWYAPVVFFTSFRELEPLVALWRSLGFVVTCVLLGTLLGWLRLASKSLGPAVIANSTFTFAAGLPYFLHGVDAGLRGALFGPAGWVVLSALIALAAWQWAGHVRVPVEEREAQPPGRWLIRVIFEPGRAPSDRTLN